MSGHDHFRSNSFPIRAEGIACPRHNAHLNSKNVSQKSSGALTLDDGLLMCGSTYLIIIGGVLKSGWEINGIETEILVHPMKVSDQLHCLVTIVPESQTPY